MAQFLTLVLLASLTVFLHCNTSKLSKHVNTRLPLKPTTLPAARISSRQSNGNRPQGGQGQGGLFGSSNNNNNRPQSGSFGNSNSNNNRPQSGSSGNSNSNNRPQSSQGSFFQNGNSNSQSQGSSSAGNSNSNAGSSAPGNSNPASSLFTRIPPLPIPPLGLGALGNFPLQGAVPDDGDGDDTVVVGFEEFILILVPQFKIKVKTPDWWGADVKFSMPITVFFDKLVVPENSPPMAFFPFGPIRPIREENKEEDDDKEEEDGRRRLSRSKRAAYPKSILSLPPPESIKGGERVTMIPKVERVLDSYGIPGRACLLRAVCEIHENALHKTYGLFGEILTLLFKISKSSYALSHAPEYHKAEVAGTLGQCESYYNDCEHSLLSDEE